MKDDMTVLMLGFDYLDPIEGFRWVKLPSFGLVFKEYYCLMDRLTSEADVVILNLMEQYRKVHGKELTAAHMAYMKNKPILGVGPYELDLMLSMFTTSRLASLEEFVEHVNHYYRY